MVSVDGNFSLLKFKIKHSYIRDFFFLSGSAAALTTEQEFLRN